jgi:hypothetical protein
MEKDVEEEFFTTKAHQGARRKERNPGNAIPSVLVREVRGYFFLPWLVISIFSLIKVLN